MCREFDFPRSTLYARQARESTKAAPSYPMRRGPKLTLPDAELLVAIRADLEASPFTGENHGEVWVRLRILRDMRVSRARVRRSNTSRSSTSEGVSIAPSNWPGSAGGGRRSAMLLSLQVVMGRNGRGARAAYSIGQRPEWRHGRR